MYVYRTDTGRVSGKADAQESSIHEQCFSGTIPAMNALVVGSSLFSSKNGCCSPADLGCDIKSSFGFIESIEYLKRGDVGVVFLDLDTQGPQGFLLLQELAHRYPQVSVIAVASSSTINTPGARHSAASLWLEKPVTPICIAPLLEHLRTKGAASAPLLGISPAIVKLRQTLRCLRDFSHPILIHGETGTGKELVARAFHQEMTNRKGPLVTVDCGSISPTLIENELFGHARGAYTGAIDSQRGLFASADGGTVFLDEIADLPLECQSRLLRLLQEGEIRPIGDTRFIKVDVRVIAATNVDLREAVHQGRFREDLYYRLAAMTIDVPPLRNRREDISLLADHFLRRDNPGKKLSLQAMRHLHYHFWPGNVRELQNRLLRAASLSEADVLGGMDLLDAEPPKPRAVLEETVKSEILKAVEEADHNVVEAARRLGIGKTTLYRKLKVYRSGG